ncbi:uncharacterized protein LOC128989457 [Macrosteles quadrilineatus]|uniref:uncharacterized protein LOC128989457 n=1 Tax=Macrosteles quadrilineatus TaxID=74068 RepID=UPI0023E2C957|nr:uncharacterized protein LOC128989457 [Macrosteles quadrilineatus]
MLSKQQGDDEKEEPQRQQTALAQEAPSTDSIAGKEVHKEEPIQTQTVPSSGSIDTLKVSKKTGKIIEIPFDKPAVGMTPLKTNGNPPLTTLNSGTSQLIVEGGGIVDLTTAQPNDSLLNIEAADSSATHSKGSKPRKGVQDPGSSVVPRKGVDPLGAINANQSSEGTSSPIKELTNVNVDTKTPLNKSDSPIKTNDQEHSEHTTHRITHPRKPVVVTDLEDVDDFEKYPIIQTSTTGEDYIIIGIVIVLGIWCSIFGALIFYRRAGEYWDRRHYRRMDFLVEGMYND